MQGVLKSLLEYFSSENITVAIPATGAVPKQPSVLNGNMCSSACFIS